MYACMNVWMCLKMWYTPMFNYLKTDTDENPVEVGYQIPAGEILIVCPPLGVSTPGLAQ